MRHRILIPLEADAESLREVEAIAAGEGRFRLAGSPRQQENLRFKRGEVVDCEIRTMPDGSRALVAFQPAAADPEYRKRRNTFAACGALVGAGLGAGTAMMFDASTMYLAAGGAIGAVAFGYCSVRWGDEAWLTLVRMLED